MSETTEVSETCQELSLFCQSDIVFCDLGDDVVLSCHIRPAISTASMEIKWQNRADLVCHYKDGQMTVNREYEGRVSLSLEDLHNGNVSLTLRDVRTSQRGLYICEVIHERQSVKDYIFLFISPEDFSLVIPSATVTADPGEDVILPVHLSPETSAVSMKVRWLKGTEHIYQYNNGQEITNSDYEDRVSLSIQELERGKLSLTLRNVQESDSGDYTCKVFHDGCLMTGKVHLEVRELRKSDDNLEVLHDIMRKIQDDLLQLKTDLPEKTLKLLQEALDEDKKQKKKPSDGGTLRSRGSMEGLPPFLGEDSTTETELMQGGTIRSRGSMEGLPPFLASDSGDENTRQTREENTATEQELTSPAVSSLVLQSERTSVNVIMQERRQESVATEQEGSSSTMQSQVQERERTSQSVSSQEGDTTQTPERPRRRPQRRHQKKEDNDCSVM